MKNATTFGDARLPERFWRKAEADTSGCWVWIASVHQRGYGQFWHDGSMKQAHRIAYAALVAPVPDEKQLDHRCRVRSCVNPAHLAVVTNKENAENRAAINRFGNPRGLHCDDGKWFGKVVHNGRAYYTRYYDDKRQAVADVIELRTQLFTNNVTDRAG